MPKRRAPDQTSGVANIGTMTAGGHIVGGNLTINQQGPDAEAIVDALEARGVVPAAETAGLQRRVIVMLAQRLKPEERLNFDQAITELERAVEVALDVITRGERGSNEDAFVNAVLAEVAEKTRNNDLDGGAQAIADALAEIDRRETAQRETAQRERIALLDAGIKQHTLRRDAVAVAAQIERSVAVQHAAERPAWHPAFRARYDEYREDGDLKGINFSLDVALECARRMLDTAADAEERGTGSILLGIPLATLGKRENGTARLEQAVDAFHDALRKWTRERVPLDWAGTQNNLGNALTRLGERESGTARLEQAVNAYHDALLERTHERVPLQWAMTQNNLGNALMTLGARESGTARMEQAVTAYHEALLERTRERVPLQWAMTQNNLGNALRRLGDRESDTTRLEQAVNAYRDALLERTRERVPLDWAMTQNNLGTVLTRLGARESGTARLEQAVTAYQNALLERTRERVPLDWATAQNNLGNALRMLGERESDTEPLEQAVTACQNALKERTRERVPLDWAMTQNNLGNALATLGARESGTARLEQAVTAYQNALLEWTRERVPFDWATAQNNLGSALATLGARESGTARLEQAVTAYQNALLEWTQEHAPYYHSRARHNLAMTLVALRRGKRRPNARPKSPSTGGSPRPISICGYASAPSSVKMRYSSAGRNDMPEPQNGQSGGVTNTGTMTTSGGHVVGGNMTVNTTTSTQSKMAMAFQPLANAVKEAPPALQPAAEATLASLKQEVEKSEQGEKPNDTVIAGLLKGLAGLVPSAVSAIASAFGTPILGAVAGPGNRPVSTAWRRLQTWLHSPSGSISLIQPCPDLGEVPR